MMEIYIYTTVMQIFKKPFYKVMKVVLHIVKNVHVHENVLFASHHSFYISL